MEGSVKTHVDAQYLKSYFPKLIGIEEHMRWKKMEY